MQIVAPVYLVSEFGQFPNRKCECPETIMHFGSWPASDPAGAGAFISANLMTKLSRKNS